MTVSELRNEASLLAAERGFTHPNLCTRDEEGSRLLLSWHNEEIDWVRDVLAPRGLVSHDHQCRDWEEAVRLLGMVPPLRGTESLVTALQFRMQASRLPQMEVREVRGASSDGDWDAE